MSFLPVKYLPTVLLIFFGVYGNLTFIAATKPQFNQAIKMLLEHCLFLILFAYRLIGSSKAKNFSPRSPEARRDTNIERAIDIANTANEILDYCLVDIMPTVQSQMLWQAEEGQAIDLDQTFNLDACIMIIIEYCSRIRDLVPNSGTLKFRIKEPRAMTLGAHDLMNCPSEFVNWHDELIIPSTQVRMATYPPLSLAETHTINGVFAIAKGARSVNDYCSPNDRETMERTVVQNQNLYVRVVGSTEMFNLLSICVNSLLNYCEALQSYDGEAHMALLDIEIHSERDLKVLAEAPTVKCHLDAVFRIRTDVSDRTDEGMRLLNEAMSNFGVRGFIQM